MKIIELNSTTNLQAISGTDVWYFSTDYIHGDLYEAEELYHQGHKVKSNALYLVHYPDGKVFRPVAQRDGCHVGNPVCDGAAIALPIVDFVAGVIEIVRFDPQTERAAPVVELSLSSVKDCYNLLLHTAPLMLTRQADNMFEIVWPEKASYAIGVRESFVFRDGDKLYFQEWFEDPDYREEVVVRDLHTGKILERFSGAIKEMPNGQHWLLV